ncbi:hypothetical protein NC653_013596 [Populus alba x Populus x berolinensis]|uniref:Uncharacterized protein n=1 Tax=Populus alba x Populus x berolinensis TaxID=444605 RepID=A0AAD6W3R4_9ROSI|nr:hypothetical protein NC653_013596 [Populus alba x Populus x berolinensis]
MGTCPFFLALELMLKALLGLATFCRVKSAFSSSEVALPVAAEEGFTRKFAYGPQAASEDMERIEFKMKFFKILQEHACAGHRVQVLNNLILGVGLTIFCAGPCLHQEHDLQGHNFLSCHVKECDILTEYKGWKLGDTSRYHSIQLYLECGNAMEPLSFLCCLNLSMLWKGGWGIRLEGSDHAPVYTSLEESMIFPHIALRLYLPDIYLPMIHGVQQTLGYQVHLQMEMLLYGHEFTDENQDRPNTTVKLQSQHTKLVPAEGTQKKKQEKKSPNLSIVAENSSTKTSPRQAEPNSRNHSSDSHAMDDKSSSPNYCKVNSRTVSQDQNEGNDGLLERQKNSNPVCKGHKEPCVARIVKKPGPTLGRRLWQIVFDLSGDAPFHFKFFWSCGDLHPILKQIEATSNGLLPNPGTNDCL